MEQPAPTVDELNRQQLADHGQALVLQLMQTGKQLLDSYSQLQLTSETQQQLEDLQRRYLRTSSDIRETLQRCHTLQQQEQASAAAAAAQPDAAQREAAAVAELQAEAAQLRQQLEAKNTAIKEVINKLRHLLDAFNMWDSHKRHLAQHAVQYAAAGTGSMV